MEATLKVVVMGSRTDTVASCMPNAIEMEGRCPTVPRKIIAIDPSCPTAAHCGSVPRPFSVLRVPRFLGELLFRLDGVAFGAAA